ncbi:transferrin receptor protein 1 [Onychostruthus taczanowskii]|uniref:transferrin receptor protein 1 n=1 Tax=Onychostruthus taczanowskii TaxID=356909 RepID=UPI001B80C3D5|nr:transferrin receptor protein 1 [Onychostruthus taczanowskii]XP_041261705.1 transferrin receptor protein 1 [Onychostruthus taczanowskii]XP_041261706.1 transferrin receptor protein 1 [Onychostruthus taczanowskii]
MDHARAAISNLFSGEPTSYTRFSIARQTDGDNSHVEMNLAADEEEGGEIGRPEHLHASMPPPRRNGKSLCFVIIAAVLLLLIGFLIGYLSYRGRTQRVNRCLDGSGNCEMTPTASYFSDDGMEEEEVPGPRILYWPELRNMLSSKLSAARLETSLRQREGKNSFEAGKVEDESTASYIHDQFTSFRLDDVWNDEHYVRLQDKGSSKNQVVIVEDGEEVLESPDAYVAYSKSGTVAGKPIYVNYGRKEDFQKIRNMRVSMDGAIIIFRAGKITLAEKVANARKEGAVGALMYPGPSNDRRADSYVPFGHAHLGTGDPFTPGFPSFNHTQFPPVESSGLPQIPVQTISREAAARLFGKMDGDKCLQEWTADIMGCKVTVSSSSKMTVKLTVNNVIVDRKILNIFGVIKGFEEPDRYVVLGAQRDSWGPGAAKAGVGTAILLELAHVISDMVKNDDYKPRRSIIFASWSAGEYGAVGATEWLEGYSTTLHAKAFTYINLDTAVLGSKDIKISASPLLYSLLETTMKRVKDPANDLDNLNSRVGLDWIKKVVPLDLDNTAYPFLAYSGIPVVSFGFYDEGDEYAFLGTTEDTLANLKRKTDNLYSLMRTAAEVAGQIALRLTHDHELFLDIDRYSDELLSFQEKLWHVNANVKELGLTLNWLYFARGDFQRAADALRRDIENSDRENRIVRRALNDRMMKVEHDFLSPYLSPKDTPFRHIFFGRGKHTLKSLLENLEQLAVNKTSVDLNELKEQLALATWTIKGAANALVGDIWNTDNEI